MRKSRPPTLDPRPWLRADRLLDLGQRLDHTVHGLVNHLAAALQNLEFISTSLSGTCRGPDLEEALADATESLTLASTALSSIESSRAPPRAMRKLELGALLDASLSEAGLLNHARRDYPAQACVRGHPEGLRRAWVHLVSLAACPGTSPLAVRVKVRGGHAQVDVSKPGRSEQVRAPAPELLAVGVPLAHAVLQATGGRLLRARPGQVRALLPIAF